DRRHSAVDSPRRGSPVPLAEPAAPVESPAVRTVSPAEAPWRAAPASLSVEARRPAAATAEPVRRTLAGVLARSVQTPGCLGPAPDSAAAVERSRSAPVRRTPAVERSALARERSAAAPAK